MFAQKSKPADKKIAERNTRDAFKPNGIQRRGDKDKSLDSIEPGIEGLNSQPLNDVRTQLNTPQAVSLDDTFSPLDTASINTVPINTVPLNTSLINAEPKIKVPVNKESTTKESENTETKNSLKPLSKDAVGEVFNPQLTTEPVTQQKPKTELAINSRSTLNTDSNLADKKDTTDSPKAKKPKQAEVEKNKTGKADTTLTASTAALTSTSSDGFIHALANSSPTEFIVGASQTGTIVNNLHQQETKSTQRALPKIPAPTGLPGINAKGTKTTQQAVPKTQSQADIKVTGEAKSKLPPVTHKTGESRLRLPPTPKPNVNETQSSGVDALSVRATIASLPTSNASINTDLGSAPQLQLDGQADPVHNELNQKRAMQDVKRNKLEANAQTQADFGEHNIYPDVKQETLSSKTEFSQPLAPNNAAITVPEGVSPEVVQAFDTQAKTQLNQQMTGEVAKVEEAKNTRDADIKTELGNTDTAIHSETERVKARQQQEQNKAQANVSKFRQDWQAENTQVAKQYKADAASAREKADAEISSEVNATDQKVARTFEEADKRVKNEETKAERKAQKVKAEAENKDEGFWSRLTSAVSSFFDKIKAGLNAIFDGLRAIVKGIIEVAKKAANAIIDLARKAVVGLIKAFGEALKALINVALAAFPNIAKKFNRLIDQAVAKASKAVNLLAEGLKKAVSLLLDVLGKVVDTILAVYQAVYNAILDVVAFIAVGMVKILQGIAYLVKAARKMPDNFWGQVSQELLGSDVTKPLPGEVVVSDKTVTNSELKEQANQAAISEQDRQLIGKTTLQEGDVIADPVVRDFQLSPELMLQLQGVKDGGELSVNTGEGGASAVNAVRQEALTGFPTTNAAKQEASTEVASSASKIAPKQTTATQQQGQIGPFSGPRERLAFLTGQMREGIAKWWSENKVLFISGLVVGVLGLILANILTGGAILAALPLLMQIVGAIFTGLAIFNATKFFGKYLVEAFPGNILAGAIALARAIAIISVELIFALLFGAKGALKGAKAAVKTVTKQGVKGSLKTGAKSLKNAATSSVRSTAKAVGELGTIGKQGAIAVFNKGKLVFNGVKAGFGKGVKSFKGLANKFAKRFKLKKVTLQRQKSRFFIWGEFNPKLLLASGEVRDPTPEELKRLRKIGGDNKVIGKRLDDGVVISNKTADKLKRGKSRFSAEEILRMEPQEIRALLPLKGISKFSVFDDFSPKALFSLGNASPDELARIAKLADGNPDVELLLQSAFFKQRKAARNAAESAGVSDIKNVPFDPVEKPANFIESALKNIKLSKARGFPFGFQSKELFLKFRKRVLDEVNRLGLPTDRVMIQGSAIFKNVPGDIDIGIVLKKGKFDDFVINKSELAGNLGKNNSKHRTIINALEKGKLDGNRIQKKSVRKSLEKELIDLSATKKGEIDFSLIKEQTGFEKIISRNILSF